MICDIHKVSDALNSLFGENIISTVNNSLDTKPFIISAYILGLLND